jgi:hypothetical protein
MCTVGMLGRLADKFKHALRSSTHGDEIVVDVTDRIDDEHKKKPVEWWSGFVGPLGHESLHDLGIVDDDLFDICDPSKGFHVNTVRPKTGGPKHVGKCSIVFRRADKDVLGRMLLTYAAIGDVCEC